jgi:hypothetical protein
LSSKISKDFPTNKRKALQTPAALNAQDNWTLLNVDDTNEIQFDYQPAHYR